MLKVYRHGGLLLLALGLSAAPTRPAGAAEVLRSVDASLKPDLGEGRMGVRVELTGHPERDVTRGIMAFLPSLTRPPFTLTFRGQPLALSPDPADPLRLAVNVGISSGTLAAKRAFGCFGGWFASLDNVGRTEVKGYLAEPALFGADRILKQHGEGLRAHTAVHGASCEAITDIGAEIFITEHVRRYLLARSEEAPVPSDLKAFHWLLEPAYDAAFEGAATDLQRDKLTSLKGWLEQIAVFSLPSSFTPDFTKVAATLDHDKTETEALFLLHSSAALIAQDQDIAARVQALDFDGLRGVAFVLDTLLSGCAGQDEHIQARACGSGALRQRFAWLTIQTQATGALRLLVPLQRANEG